MQSTNDDIPTVIFPDKSGEYKVIQFENNERQFVRFQKAAPCNYHENILKRFAIEIDSEIVKEEGPEGLIAFLPKESKFKMVGAGRCNIDVDKKSALFYGLSEGYRIGISNRHIEKLRVEVHDWDIK